MIMQLTGAAILMLPLAAQAHTGHGMANLPPLHTVQHGYEPLLLGLGISAIAWVFYRVGKR